MHTVESLAASAARVHHRVGRQAGDRRRQHAPKIEKAFGYRTVGDLLAHYPRRWVDKGSLSDSGDVEPDLHVTVIGRVVRSRQHPYSDRRRGGLAYRLEAVVATEDAQLMLTFFDKAQHIGRLASKQLRPGRSGLFSGKVGTFRGTLQLVQPADTDVRR
jgi:ATP-dependent DNA helicase RecG